MGEEFVRELDADALALFATRRAALRPTSDTGGLREPLTRLCQLSESLEAAG